MGDITKILFAFWTFDLFGKRIQLKFKGKPHFSSIVGKFFTWACVLMLFLSFGFFARELVVRESPNTIKSELHTLDPPGFDIKNSEIF
jgi:hypothetical protein